MPPTYVHGCQPLPVPSVNVVLQITLVGSRITTAMAPPSAATLGSELVSAPPKNHPVHVFPATLAIQCELKKSRIAMYTALSLPQVMDGLPCTIPPPNWKFWKPVPGM